MNQSVAGMVKFPRTDLDTYAARPLGTFALALASDQEVMAAYRKKLLEGKALALPVLFELRSRRGAIEILADGALELSEHPACKYFLDRDLALETLFESEHPRGDPEALLAGRIDGLTSHRLQTMSENCSFCALRLALELCPDWIGAKNPAHGLDFARAAEHWRRGSSCIRIDISSLDPQSPAGAQSQALQDMILATDGLYERRHAQAGELAKALGPSAAVQCTPHGEMNNRAALWEDFFAKREATLLRGSIAQAKACATTPRV